MRIGIDIDGVLADFGAVCVDALRKEMDLPADYVFRHWSFSDILSPEIWSNRFFPQLLQTENLWYKMPPIEHEVEALRNFIKDHGDAEIYYITARPPSVGASTEVQTQLWLSEQDLGPLGANVIVAEWKLEQIQALDIKYYVDDLPPTVAAVSVLSDCQSRVLARPYNENWLPNLPRVTSMAEFLLQVETHVRS